MKTKVLLLALLSGFIFTLSAQEYQPQIGYSTEPGYKTNFMKNKAGDNWFISAGAGMSILYGDQNSKADFKNRLNVNPNFSFGKWFNPYLGLRFAATGGVLHGFEGDNAQFMQHNKYVMAHVDFMWDVINFWGRYDEKRVFRLIPWVGVGYAQRFKTSESNGSIPRTESPSINFGLLTAFRLSERLDLNIEAQGAFLVEEWNRYAGRCALIGVFGCVGEGSEISNLKINCHKSILSKDGFTQMDYTFAGGLAAIVLPGATVKNCTVDARLVFDGKKYTFAGNAIGLNLGTIDNVVSASKVLPVQKNKNADSHIGLITGYCGKGSEVLSYGSYEGMIPSGVDLADGEWISVELYISSDDAFFRKYVEMPDENGDYAFRHVALFQDEMISYVKTLIHKNDNSTEILSTREIAFMPDNNVLNTKSGNYVTQVY